MARRTRRIPIDELLAYWVDLSKRPTLTLEDIPLFHQRAEATEAHFRKSGDFSLASVDDLRLVRINYMLFAPGHALQAARDRKRLTNQEYNLMKRIAKDYTGLIKKYFGMDVAVAITSKTPLQDAEALLGHSTKLTYKWAAGIIISNHI